MNKEVKEKLDKLELKIDALQKLSYLFYNTLVIDKNEVNLKIYDAQ